MSIEKFDIQVNPQLDEMKAELEAYKIANKELINELKNAHDAIKETISLVTKQTRSKK